MVRQGRTQAEIAKFFGVSASAVSQYAAAHKAGKEFPYFAHEPIYVVDLDAITFGTKIATVLALDVLGRE